MSDKPMAAKGLISYRYPSPYNWVMIGATDHADALMHANRSLDTCYAAPAVLSKLEIWNGEKYVKVGA